MDATEKVQHAPAPLLEEEAFTPVFDAVQRMYRAGFSGEAEVIQKYISDLTRRLAEAEECLTIAHMDGYHKGQKAGQSEHNNSVRMGQYILEAKTEKRLREAAEASVRELEAQLSGVGVRQCREAVERLHKAEAERDALRKQVREFELRDRLRCASTPDELQAALAATEVKP